MAEASRHLPPKAIAVTAAVVFCGAIAFGLAVETWETADLLKFIGVLTVTLLTVAARLSVPSRGGNVPVTFIFVLVGLLELSPSETVILGVIAALCQTLWDAKERQQPLPMAFHVSAMALSAGLAVEIYGWPMILPTAYPQVIHLGLAAAIFGIAQTLAIAVVVSASDELSFFRTWRSCFFRTMPHYLGGALVALGFSSASRLVGWQTLVLTAPIVYLVYKAYNLHVSRLENQTKHAEDVSALHLRTIQALALAIEAKDQTTHGHLARVQVYAREIGRELKLSEKEQDALLAASLLHDIGKLAVPEHIISKPGRLSPAEFEKMKIHPTVGAEILEQVQFPYPVVPIVRTHHERWDGKGYPAGIQGEDIPIGARILAVVDCLDALASDRQYRRALPLDEAMNKVEAEAGTAFDPQVVEVLKRRYVELEQMAKAEGSAMTNLSTEVKVDRGDAPAAGFESHAVRAVSKGAPVDYSTLIAEARSDMHSLIEFSNALHEELTVDDTMSMLAGRLRRLVPHHCMAIWRRNEDTLIPAFVVGDDSRVFSSIEIPVGQGLSGWVAENHKPIVNGNPSVETGHLADSQKYSSLRSAIAVPLEGPQGVTGVLSLYHADRDAFSKEHLRLLQTISAKIAVSVEHALRVIPPKLVAPKQFVTGVVNSRELFVQMEQELGQARREKSPVTLVVLDIDHFQQIASRLGRQDSEGFVRAFALGLKSVCREHDTVARMGGSEFAVIVPGATAEDMAGRLPQFREVLAGTYSDRVRRDLLTVSIGTASYPTHGDDAGTLLSAADQSMYADRHARAAEAAMRKRPEATLADTLLSQAIH